MPTLAKIDGRTLDVEEILERDIPEEVSNLDQTFFFYFALVKHRRGDCSELRAIFSVCVPAHHKLAIPSGYFEIRKCFTFFSPWKVPGITDLYIAKLEAISLWIPSKYPYNYYYNLFCHQ